MPRGRFVNKKICEDERVHSLPMPARLFFTWMILNADAEGRLTANPKLLNRKVFPLEDFTDEEIKEWLQMMNDAKKQGEGLIELYQVDGRPYLHFPGWDGEQQGLRKDKEAKGKYGFSDVPPPPGLAAEIPIGSKIKDKKFAKICQCYEDNIGKLGPVIGQRLEEISDKYPDGWFERAVEEAVASNVKKLKYIEAVLSRWNEEGVDPIKLEITPSIPIEDKGEPEIGDY